MIVAGVSDSFLLDLAKEVHRSTDTYRLALYTASASLSPKTKIYSAAHEVPDHGAYHAGGCTLDGYFVSDDGICFDCPTFKNSTITNPAGYLIYNASKGDKAVCVIRFKEPVSSVAGTFEVVLPDPVVPLRSV